MNVTAVQLDNFIVLMYGRTLVFRFVYDFTQYEHVVGQWRKCVCRCHYTVIQVYVCCIRSYELWVVQASEWFFFVSLDAQVNNKNSRNKLMWFHSWDADICLSKQQTTHRLSVFGQQWWEIESRLWILLLLLLTYETFISFCRNLVSLGMDFSLRWLDNWRSLFCREKEREKERKGERGCEAGNWYKRWCCVLVTDLPYLHLICKLIMPGVVVITNGQRSSTWCRSTSKQ